jgi:hypothetical protein
MQIEIDEKILDKGNNIEVKKNRDGQIVVMEVKKTIVQRVSSCFDCEGEGK